MNLLRAILFLFVVKPFVLLVLGLHVRGRFNLPRKGPAIVVANHNSHLDTLILVSLFPLRLLPLIRPVGAKDYFTCKRCRAWISLNIIRLIPLERKPSGLHEHPLDPCVQALERGEILILFPEGSRGNPEQMAPLKSGVAHLAEVMPEVPVVPVYLKGTGKALPKGEAVLVPHICDVAVGEPVRWDGGRKSFMNSLQTRFAELNQQISSE